MLLRSFYCGLKINNNLTKVVQQNVDIDYFENSKVYSFSDRAKLINYRNIGDKVELSIEGLIGRICNYYSDEIIYNRESIYGTRVVPNDENIGDEKFMRFSKYFNNVFVDLKDSHKNADRLNWNLKFRDKKTFYMFFKPFNTRSDGNIFKFCGGTSDNPIVKSELSILSSGNVQFKDESGATLISPNTYNYDQWNFVSISFEKKSNGSINVTLILNDTVISKVLEGANYQTYKSFYICEGSDCSVAQSSSSSSDLGVTYFDTDYLEMWMDVYMVGISANEYDNQDLINIYNEGLYFLTHSSYNNELTSQISYINQDLFKDYELALLNGDFTTTLLNKPVEVVDRDKSYKNKKLRNFELIQGRFVYKAYDIVKPSLTSGIKSKLVYDFNVKKEGRFFVKFKVDDSYGFSSTDPERTVFSLYKQSAEYLKVNIKNNGKLKVYLAGGRSSEVNLYVTDSDWHIILVDYNTNKLYVGLDDYPGIELNYPTYDLTGGLLYVGSTNVGGTKLNGHVEIVAYSPLYSSTKTQFDTEATRVFNNSTVNIVTNNYDSLGRLTSKKISTSQYESDDKLYYISQTNLISREEIVNGSNTLNYTYDTTGRVKTYFDQLYEYAYNEYTYDSLGRIVEVKDNLEDRKYKYTYDESGNIKTKVITNSSNTTLLNINYVYDTLHKDQLVRVEDKLSNINKTITYNSIGQPTSINNVSLTWEGRNLKTYGSNTYCYNENGIRYKKVTSNGTYTYELEGSNIIRMSKNNTQVFDFTYDSNNQLVSMSYNGKEYFYIRNILGDILGIIDNRGDYVVKYILLMFHLLNIPL